jgi:hypothetical protein
LSTRFQMLLYAVPCPSTKIHQSPRRTQINLRNGRVSPTLGAEK